MALGHNVQCYQSHWVLKASQQGHHRKEGVMERSKELLRELSVKGATSPGFRSLKCFPSHTFFLSFHFLFLPYLKYEQLVWIKQYNSIISSTPIHVKDRNHRSCWANNSLSHTETHIGRKLDGYCLFAPKRFLHKFTQVKSMWVVSCLLHYITVLKSCSLASYFNCILFSSENIQ